jgi:hypothetical protein
MKASGSVFYVYLGRAQFGQMAAGDERGQRRDETKWRLGR